MNQNLGKMNFIIAINLVLLISLFLLLIYNCQHKLMHREATTENLRARLEQIEQEDIQEKQIAEQARYNVDIISSMGEDSKNAERKALIQKIKKKELQKIQRVRLSTEAQSQLDKIHYLIYSQVEGCQENNEINFSNYLTESNKNRTKFSLEHGVLYFQKLMKVVGNIQFVDKQIMRSLCNQLIRRERVILLNYYIDWAFYAEYGGTVVKYIKSLWEDLKYIVVKIIDSIQSAWNQIWKKLRCAWRSLFG